MTNFVNDTAHDIGDTLNNTFQNIGQGLNNTVNAINDTISNTVDNTIEGVNNTFNALNNSVNATTAPGSLNITTDTSSLEISSGLANFTQAGFTYYEAYALCCPANDNYDPKADTKICDTTSICSNPGLFSAESIGQ